LKLELESSAASDSVEGAWCNLDVESVVGFPHCWRRDITVRDFCCGKAAVLKFVQIDSRFFLHLLQAADQLVVGKIHS